MSSKLLSRHAELQAQQKQIEEELRRLESDEAFVREKEFKDRLFELMEEYNRDTNTVIGLLSPSQARDSSAGDKPAKRRKRRLKIYKNPNTGETVQTRGGNQKRLKAWKEEYGEATVESWLVETQA